MTKGGLCFFLFHLLMIYIGLICVRSSLWKAEKNLVVFVASGIHPQEHLFLFFLCGKMGFVVHFSSQPSPAIVGEESRNTCRRLWKYHRIPCFQPWEDLVYGHGKKIMEGHVAFQSGIASWDWRWVGWGVGFFQARWRWIWRDVGVCFFLKGGEGWNLTSERKISSSCFFKVWEGGREGGDLISQWFFCGSFRVRKWFGILFQTRVYYSGTSQLYKPLTQTTKEHQFPISCNGGPKISHKRHQLKKGFNRWRMMENNDAEKWSGMVATTWSR